MASTPTTRWQVSGYRFLVRRMEHALVRRDVRMLHDPMRSQSRAFTVGLVAASVGLAGCGALALLRPQDKIGDSAIVVGKDSGAMYVAYEDTFRPVLNLASARLILGSPDEPAVVADDEIASRPRGPLMGIPGAPSALNEAQQASWTVCDTVTADGGGPLETSILVGDTDLGDGRFELGDDQAMLVSNSGTTYLVHRGARAQIDLDSAAVRKAYGLGDVVPRPVSKALLNALPEQPRIAAPEIGGQGREPADNRLGVPVGSVVRTGSDDATEYYLVLLGGVQRVSKPVADIVFETNGLGALEIPQVRPDVVNKIAQVDDVAVGTFPTAALDIVDTRSDPVGCLSWTKLADSDVDGTRNASVGLIAGRSLPMPADARTVTLAQADGPGDNADAVWVQPGASGFVQSTGISPDSQRVGSVFVLSDTGVRYGLADGGASQTGGSSHPAASALGAPAHPALAPWPVLDLLAPGPVLSRSDALVAHDGMAAAQGSVAVTPAN
ncbi:type VII secretion protein EccB [Rhodococcus rhodnii]|uniref:Esx cluster lipoprotein n=2 Tax=Rhodococcus rhodnii TaxID=38312 RepID=R7WHP5_9NOCA|nr:type VII secretion protein EccB [Rhodococcus rhodnii]EOM74653.1 esx cluster lipoprotein [Rhodococcus rhodnii LMG 5362]TXG90430.1 type VII secretion protein EccB [Rhodococcus rhodnii]